MNRDGMRLTEFAQAERDEFESEYGPRGNCSCHLGGAPCSSCTHPGNPQNQDFDEFWEADLPTVANKPRIIVMRAQGKPLLLHLQQFPEGERFVAAFTWERLQQKHQAEAYKPLTDTLIERLAEVPRP